MKLTIENPSKAYVDATAEELDSLRQELTYTNTALAHDVKRLYNNLWFRRKNPIQWQKAVDEMKAKVKRTLVFTDDKGTYIRPGSIPHIWPLGDIEIQNNIVYPTPKKVAWKKPLPFELHAYQTFSAERLINVKHGNVELCTGSGKSAILLKTCRETGYTTAIVAPSKSIFLELLEKFELHFGKGMVGTFGAGKKKLGKRFTICIGDSIANVKPGTEEWDFFSNLDAMYIDESHTWGADSLETICFGVFEKVPIRNFYSGTQTRGDGAEKLLYSIIGKTVNSLSTRQAWEGGFICPHDYRIVKIESSNPNFNDSDVLQMKRAHFLKNRNVS